tara:strand:- start:1309 stop:2508 length:1200 start_codon:yes stop_codon:yes gene_type:complete
MAKTHKQGTITKNGSQGYIARIKNPKTNKFISKRAKTKDQAVEKLKEIREIIESDSHFANKSMTLSMLAEKYFQNREFLNEVRKNTFRKEKSVFSKIEEKFGQIPLYKIGTGFFIELSNHLKEYAENTIADKKLVMMQIFNYGLKNDILPGNFDNYLNKFWNKKITPDLIAEKRGYVFSPDELNLIWNETDKHYPALTLHGKLGAFQGMRCEEISALHWRDFDFDNNIIKVRNTVTRFGVSNIMKGNQKFARRNLPILRSLLPNIRDYEEKSLSRNITKDQLIFPRSVFRKKDAYSRTKKNYVDAGVMSYLYGRIFNQKDFPQFWIDNGKKDECVVQSHNFRRTFATRSAQSGMAIQDLSRILGHSNLKSTMIYYEDTLDQKREAMNFMDDYVINNNIL